MAKRWGGTWSLIHKLNIFCVFLHVFEVSGSNGSKNTKWYFFDPKRPHFIDVNPKDEPDEQDIKKNIVLLNTILSFVLGGIDP